MLSKTPMTGRYLPPKTLCFTFDDGPGLARDETGKGPKTAAIAEYLYNEGICATFFVTGKNVIAYPDAVDAIIKYKHILGNHTYNHPNIPVFLKAGGDVINELNETSQALARHLDATTTYFRPPYGEWCEGAAIALNSNNSSNFQYLGPYNYDIDGSDWHYWERGLTAGECAKNYIEVIKKVGQGIVLMHDSTADNELIRDNNLTYETLQILIPYLKGQGYRFISLDEVVVENASLTNKLRYQFNKVRKKVMKS